MAFEQTYGNPDEGPITIIVTGSPIPAVQGTFGSYEEYLTANLPLEAETAPIQEVAPSRVISALKKIVGGQK
jgi:hypothetical protein